MPATRWGRQRNTTVSIYGLQVAKHTNYETLSSMMAFILSLYFVLRSNCSLCASGINRVLLPWICSNLQVFCISLAFTILYERFVIPRNSHLELVLQYRFYQSTEISASSSPQFSFSNQIILDEYLCKENAREQTRLLAFFATLA